MATRPDRLLSSALIDGLGATPDDVHASHVQPLRMTSRAAGRTTVGGGLLIGHHSAPRARFSRKGRRGWATESTANLTRTMLAIAYVQAADAGDAWRKASKDARDSWLARLEYQRNA